MTPQEKQQLAAEFGRLKHDAKQLPIFAWEHQDLIADALAEWAQFSPCRPPAEILRLALEEAHQLCLSQMTKRVAAERSPQHSNLALAQWDAGVTACAEAIACLKEQPCPMRST